MPFKNVGLHCRQKNFVAKIFEKSLFAKNVKNEELSVFKG